jgi:serine/threonine protein kinase
MICCLNPDCDRPFNADTEQYCQCCGDRLQLLLRDRYKVLKPINQGGFGKIYLAEDQATSAPDQSVTTCVIKQLMAQKQESWSSLQLRRLFEQEAALLQRLGDHPQVPALIEAFRDETAFYLVQQHLPGQDLLQELHQQGIFNERQVRRVLLGLLTVVQFIGDRGIIHGDIKPENAIRTPEGKLVLIDFGLAGLYSSTEDSSSSALLLTPGYASPEQMRGGALTPASDLFSIGATGIHLLTGISPTRLWSEQGFSWITNWQQYLSAALSPPFAAVLNQLLHLDLKQRYASAQQALQDLQVPSFSPTSTPPANPSTSPRRTSWVRRLLGRQD